MSKIVRMKSVKGRVAPVPEAPAYVAADPVAAAEWATVARVLHDAGRLPPERVALLANYCHATALVRRLDEAMAGQPLVLTTATGARMHPALHARTKAAATLATLASRLGLVTSGPGNVRAGTKPGAGPDPYDDLGI